MSTTSIDSAGAVSSATLTSSRSQHAAESEMDKAPYDRCPQCLIQFDFLKRNNGHYSKVPLILRCKHTVCEDCIRKSFLGQSVSCPVCKERFSVPRQQLDKLTELFTPHFSLIGYLMWNKNSPVKRSMGLVSTGLSLKNKQPVGPCAKDLGSVLDGAADSDNEDYGKLLSSFQFDMCTEHVNCEGYINIFCKTCNEKVCCSCFLEKHSGHMGDSLYKLSKEEMEELQELKVCSHMIIKQLQMSEKKVKELKVFDVSNVEADIKRYFTDWHGRLQLIERRLKEQLSSYKVESNDLEQICAVIKENITRVVQLGKLLNTRDFKKINIKAVFEEVKSLRDIPCRLVSDHEFLEPIQFLHKHSLEGLEEDFSLQQSSGIEYILSPIEHWSDISVSTQISAPEIKIQEPKKKSPHVSIQRNPALQQKSSINEEFTEVIVTHINSIESFYVQKCEKFNTLKTINSTIAKRSQGEVQHEDIVLGRLFGVLFIMKGCKKWLRARITKILFMNDSEYRYGVFYIDYGNCQDVTRNKLKYLDLYTSKQPPCAIECKMTSTLNYNYDEATSLVFAQIINGKTLFMKAIKKTDNGKCEVDLLVQNSTGSLGSIRKLLPQVEKPTSNPELSDEEQPLTKEFELFKNSKVFHVGQREDVIITYLKDPDYICIQLVQNIGEIEKMKNEMKTFYESKYTCCVPVANTDVIVKCEDTIQGNWHRARVMSVDISRKQAQVKFVDWGGEAVVPWPAIKILVENFTRIESQGIIVKMADVEPVGSVWSDFAIDFLNRQIADNVKFTMAVSSVEPLEVVFFRITSVGDVCLNALLVEHKFANSTGNLSETVTWPNSPKIEEMPTDDYDFSSQLIKKTEQVMLNDDDSIFTHGILYQPVSIAKLESPDLIYIKFGIHKSKEEELQKHLQIHYSHQRECKKTWKTLERCVVYDFTRKKYFRAVIRSTSRDGSCLVYLYDQGRELVVPNKSVYIEDPYFTVLPSLAFKCRLSGIKPAGDSGKWTILANEILEKIFKSYKTIVVQKLEGIRTASNNIMGVHMWYMLTIPGNALEPSKFKYVSINKSLLECGVAFSSSKILFTKPIEQPRLSDAEIEKIPSTSTDADATISSNAKAVEEPKTDKIKDWNQIIIEDEKTEVGQSVVVGWPSILPPECREFSAVVTCVDSDGVFSVRDDTLLSIYKTLEENLQDSFSSMELQPSEDYTWRKGERCTVHYDEGWYRAVIIDTDSLPKIHIEMIDFGSAHFVDPSTLFKVIMFDDIEPLINRVQLYDLCPKDGVWPEDFMNDMLQIVEETVKVVIEGDLQVAIPAAEIYLKDGRSLNNEILRKCPNLTRLMRREALIDNNTTKENDSNEAVEAVESNEEFADGEQQNSETEEVNEHVFDVSSSDCEYYRSFFTYAPLPTVTNGKMKMRVASVVGCQKVILNVAEEDPLENSDEFALLYENIQTAINLPALENVAVGQTCVCLKPKDNVWARGVVLGTDNLDFGYVLIFFVDYGTLQMADVHDLRVMQPEWFAFPVYNRVAAIATQGHGSNASLVGKTIDVAIISEDPLTVDLY